MKRIILLVATAALLIASLSGCGEAELSYQRQEAELFQYSMYDALPNGTAKPTEEHEQLLAGYRMAEENGVLTLYVQDTTGYIAVLDKRSGKLYFSVSPLVDQDTTATEDTKKIMKSVLQLTYFDGSVEKTVNSFEMLDPDKLTIEQIDGGIRVTYVLGDSKRGLEDIPQKLTDARFQELFVDHPALKANDKKRAKIYYEQDEATGVWTLVDTKNTTLNMLSQILDRIEYTQEDLERDNEENGLVTQVSNRVNFTVPVEYTLEGESLRVSVPMDQVQYTAAKPLLSLCVNRYFGATASTDGAILLPEGTGGLMRFSQADTDTGAYSSGLYGSDDTYTRENSAQADNENMLPIFGLYEKENGFLCIIEEGDAQATIGAEKANGRTDLNGVWATFTVRSVIRAILGDGSMQSDVRVVQDEMYTGLLSWKYSFITGEDLSYGDLAGYYRGYLQAKYGLTTMENTTMPLQLGLVGGVHVEKSFLGFQYKGTRVLTDYEAAAQIMDALNTQGIQRINALYSGVLRGGLGDESIVQLKADNALGKEAQLQALAEREGISLYLMMDALTVPKETSGYRRYKHTAKTIDDSLAKRYQFNIVDLSTESYDYIISPLQYGYFGEALRGFTEETAFEGLTFTDMGNRLYSHNGNGVLFRQDTKALSIAQLQSYAASRNLILTNPYEAAFPYAQSIIGLPSAKVTKVIDQSVPFYQMAIHSLINYSAAPINEAVDVTTAVLNCAETGSIPYFKLFAAAQDSLTDTKFSQMYSHGFYTWQDTVVSVWQRLSELYAQVCDLPITDHCCLQDGVYRTVYGGEIAVYTNYNSNAVAVDGITVEAEDFRIEVWK